jgi:ABC-2 type transport system ATP-binding protein
VIVFEDLTKTFSDRKLPAIEGVNLELRDGEVLGLVGLNGAGKTTTIRIAAGVSLPTRGTVRVDGRDIVQEKARASQAIGWVPELFPFEPSARALPLLEYFAGFHGIPRSSAQPICRERLVQFGLAGREHDRLRTFSQGMKKRFALASALISDPQNLLLDEILNGLDPEGLAYVRGWVARLRKEGRAILLSSHLLVELQALADRVAFVHQGRILRTIEVAQLPTMAEVSLQITLDRIDDAVLQYLSGLGTVRVENTSVTIAGPRADAGTINAELVRRGYVVRELRTDSTSLEAYFLGLVGAGSGG